MESTLRSLIRQLGAGAESLPDAVRSLTRIHRRRGSHPSIPELLEALHSVILNLNKDAFLVLDALDEFPEDSRHGERFTLLNVIESLVERGHSNLHLLVTSRRENDISSRLGRLSNPPKQLDVEAPLFHDLELLYDNTIQGSPALRDLSEDTKAEIRSRLVSGEQR